MPKKSVAISSKGQGRRPQSGLDMIYKELTAPENRSVVYSVAMFTGAVAILATGLIDDVLAVV